MVPLGAENGKQRQAEEWERSLEVCEDEKAATFCV